MREEWRPVVGYEGLYEVSNIGRVKSLGNGKSNNSKERILKPQKYNNGYLLVQLCKDCKAKGYLVHRLVAQAFLPNPDNLPEVNHKDENPKNNNVNNLEWCTQKYNSNYGTRNKRIAEKLTNHSKTSKPVLAIHKINGLILEFPSTHEAERQLGINQQNICACCKGKKKSCGGFYWMYANNNDDAEQ